MDIGSVIVCYWGISPAFQSSRILFMYSRACFAFSFGVECVSVNEVWAETRAQPTNQHRPERDTCKDAKKLKWVEKEYGLNSLTKRHATKHKKNKNKEENNWQIIAQHDHPEKHPKEVQITMDANMSWVHWKLMEDTQLPCIITKQQQSMINSVQASTN